MAVFFVIFALLCKIRSYRPLAVLVFTPTNILSISRLFSLQYCSTNQVNRRPSSALAFLNNIIIQGGTAVRTKYLKYTLATVEKRNF